MVTGYPGINQCSEIRLHTYVRARCLAAMLAEDEGWWEGWSQRVNLHTNPYSSWTLPDGLWLFVCVCVVSHTQHNTHTHTHTHTQLLSHKIFTFFPEPCTGSAASRWKPRHICWCSWSRWVDLPLSFTLSVSLSLFLSLALSCLSLSPVCLSVSSHQIFCTPRTEGAPAFNLAQSVTVSPPSLSWNIRACVNVTIVARELNVWAPLWRQT